MTIELASMENIFELIKHSLQGMTLHTEHWKTLIFNLLFIKYTL